MKGGGHAHRVPDAGKGLPSVGGSVGDMSVLLRCGDMSICFIYLFFCLMSWKYITVLRCNFVIILAISCHGTCHDISLEYRPMYLSCIVWAKVS